MSKQTSERDPSWTWVASAYRATSAPSRAETERATQQILTQVDEERGHVETTETKTAPSDSMDVLRGTSTEVPPHARTSALLSRAMPRIWWGITAALAAATFIVGIVVGRDIPPSINHQQDINSISETKSQTHTVPTPNVEQTTRSTTHQATRTVQFVLSAPRASRVTLVGDFNEWDVDATPMHMRRGTGLWTVSVPLPTGRHVYAFVVDGDEWVADPSAPRVAVDAFGAPNSVVIVGRSL
jgi:hypothetical protein